MKRMIRDIFVVGFAMFAIFFGSGNLIFPPQIGLAAGNHVFFAIIGLALTGILFPMLAVASVSNVGYGIQDMMQRVTPWWHLLYMVMGLFVVCFGTIPRCGGVAFEAGFQSIVGTQLPTVYKIVFLFVFFAISYYFAMNKSTVIDKIGNYLTPVLLIALLIVIGIAIVKPIDTLHAGSIATGSGAFLNGFTTGYNTGDVGTGIVCAGIFITAFMEKGYKDRSDFKKLMLGIIIIGFVLLFAVYAGLSYLGAQGTQIYTGKEDSTFLLSDLVNRVAGYSGSIFLSLAILFACLTTAIGMIATTGLWLESLTKQKLNYKYGSLIITIIIFMVSSMGVTKVLTISGPLFMLLFPMSVVLTLLGIFRRFVPNDGAWKGAVIVATLMSIFDALNVANANGLTSINLSSVNQILSYIPFSEAGFTWLVPTIIGFFAGAIIFKLMGKESIPYKF